MYNGVNILEIKTLSIILSQQLCFNFCKLYILFSIKDLRLLFHRLNDTSTYRKVQEKLIKIN